jgi:hypothetical protein
MSLFAAGDMTGTKAVVGYDVIGANLSHAPAGAQLAGYTTGTGPVPWPASAWAQHPTAVRICQDPGATDHTADVLDVESGAATFGDCAPWAKAALGNFAKGTRPGQRQPVIYASGSAITPVVNALIAGGVKSGVGLWVANWSIGEAVAFADVVNASGPFPIMAVQWKSGAFYDTDVFSQDWLSNRSGGGSLHEHTSAAGDTIGKIADGRNMTSAGWVALQAKLDAANAETLLDAATLKTGTKWLSVNK